MITITDMVCRWQHIWGERLWDLEYMTPDEVTLLHSKLQFLESSHDIYMTYTWYFKDNDYLFDSHCPLGHFKIPFVTGLLKTMNFGALGISKLLS